MESQHQHRAWCGVTGDMVGCAVVYGVVDVVWCGVVWCGVMCCDVVWCGVVLDTVWCGVVWCDVM